MKPSQKAYIYREGGKFISDLVRLRMAKPKQPSPSPESQELASETTEAMITTQEPAKPPRVASEGEIQPIIEEVATACVPCAIGHYSGAAKLLNEAFRFRDDGITSNQVLDDIAGAIGELNAMERVDLTPEKLQNSSSWERPIAEEALRESRKLRHRLEGITSMEEVEKAAADTESYYKKLNRDWYKGRFQHLGRERAEAIEKRISPEDKERIKKRSEEIIEEV